MLCARVFGGISISDKVTLKRLEQTFKVANYVACPHTAVGIEAVERYREQTSDMTPVISLATAHPAKFPDALEQAGLKAPKHKALERLWLLDTNVETIPPTLNALREVLSYR